MLIEGGRDRFLRKVDGSLGFQIPGGSDGGIRLSDGSRAAFTMSKSSSSAMPWVATPLSSAALELVLAPEPTCARDLPKARWVLLARPTDLARLRRQRITSIMAAMPPSSEPAPTTISTVSMVPMPASGTVSPALVAGGVIVRTV